MQRRSFLGAITIGAGVASVSSIDGCGGARPVLGTSEALELVRRLERGVQYVRAQPIDALARAAQGTRPDLQAHVFRATVESLVALDVLRSIPDGAAVPPVLADALAESWPTLDRSMHTHRALLSRLPEPRRRNFDQTVRADPDLPMNVAEALDQRARIIGVPADNRARLRHSALSLGTRMRRQSAGAVIDDGVQRLDRLLARSAVLPEELARRTDAIVDAMWQTSPDSSQALGAPMQAPAPTPSVAVSQSSVVPSRFGASSEMIEPTEPIQWDTYWARPGDSELRAAAILMPLGLVSCGVTLLIGLVALIVGLAQNGAWDGRTPNPDPGEFRDERAP